MKIQANFIPRKDRLDLHFDHEAQITLDEMARQIRGLLRGDDPRKIAKEFNIPQSDDLFRGLPLLEKIGSARSSHLVTTGTEINLALGLTCWSAFELDVSGKQTWGPAVFELARATPLLFPRRDLPPLEEVFNEPVVSSRCGRYYQLLCRRCAPGELYLFYPQALELWLALRPIPRPGWAIEDLIGFLEASLVVFCTSLGRLVEADNLPGLSNSEENRS